ncbi:hypothetical protein GJAV_G00050920 [Gymnothorax javanicus]|nr:hypothetical protein GJAV_G00050920 [Gymnothorax javanicus]
METVTVVSLDGAQTLLKTVPPVAAFSVQESSSGSAVVFSSALSEQSLENGHSVWPPELQTVTQLCGDKPLEQWYKGVRGSTLEIDSVTFSSELSVVPDHGAALFGQPSDCDPVSSSLGFTEAEPRQDSIPESSSEKPGNISALCNSQEVASCVGVVRSGLEVEAVACAVAVDQSENLAPNVVLSSPQCTSSIEPDTSRHQGEPDCTVDPLECIEEYGCRIVISRHVEPSISVPTLTVSPELPRIVKNKPSSIAFADYPDLCRAHLFISERLPRADSSSEDDDDDDDVFPELPQCREFLAGRLCRGEQKRNGMGAGQDTPTSHSSVSNGGCQEEMESLRGEESPQMVPPWSESMTQLMKKLDRLNLDIEEALSSGSSPSHTPSVSRKRPPDGTPATVDNSALKESSALRNQRPEECRDLHSCPALNPPAAGVPASPKKTEVAAKMNNERAGTDGVT